MIMILQRSIECVSQEAVTQIGISVRSDTFSDATAMAIDATDAKTLLAQLQSLPSNRSLLTLWNAIAHVINLCRALPLAESFPCVKRVLLLQFHAHTAELQQQQHLIVHMNALQAISQVVQSTISKLFPQQSITFDLPSPSPSEVAADAALGEVQS